MIFGFERFNRILLRLNGLIDVFYTRNVVFEQRHLRSDGLDSLQQRSRLIAHRSRLRSQIIGLRTDILGFGEFRGFVLFPNLDRIVDFVDEFAKARAGTFLTDDFVSQFDDVVFVVFLRRRKPALFVFLHFETSQIVFESDATLRQLCLRRCKPSTRIFAAENFELVCRVRIRFAFRVGNPNFCLYTFELFFDIAQSLLRIACLERRVIFWPDDSDKVGIAVFVERLGRGDDDGEFGDIAWARFDELDDAMDFVARHDNALGNFGEFAHEAFFFVFVGLQIVGKITPPRLGVDFSSDHFEQSFDFDRRRHETVFGDVNARTFKGGGFGSQSRDVLLARSGTTRQYSRRFVR